MRTKKPIVQIIFPGDLRDSANLACESARQSLDSQIGVALDKAGYCPVNLVQERKRGHRYLGSQKEGFELRRSMGYDQDAPLILGFSAWSYAHHALPILVDHVGPILLAANWSGTWPGLVGMLQQRATCTSFGIKTASTWLKSYAGQSGKIAINKWLSGTLTPDVSHLRHYDDRWRPSLRLHGERLASKLLRDGASFGVFDEGCMGMWGAIVPDHLLTPLGIFKERMSQSTWYASTLDVFENELPLVESCFQWLLTKGMKFHFGRDGEKHLNINQVKLQCAMYIAMVRLVDEFGLTGVGIQYQQGLKDLLPASDLVEGLLKSRDRFPVSQKGRRKIIRPGMPILEANEVDEGCLMDALLNRMVCDHIGDPLTQSLHDLRFGDEDRSGQHPGFYWVAEISGSAPAEHCAKGWNGCEGFRQPSMYFRLGGSTLRNIAKPGYVVYSRLRVMGERVGGGPCAKTKQTLRLDVGVGRSVKLSAAETQRRWEATTEQWPIMHLETIGASKDQIMGDWGSNHWQCLEPTTKETAFKVAHLKAIMAQNLGIDVVWVGALDNE